MTPANVAQPSPQKRDGQPDEEKMLAELRRQAGNEKARRAREQFERSRQREIENIRKAAGLCTMCGRSLNAIARILGARRHRSCRSFRE